MKNIRKILTVLMLMATAAYFASCVDGDFDEPPLLIPKVDFEANTTISGLKGSYTAMRMITDDIIIKGVVVANDESGNLYKKIIIQDSTAGIELALDRTNLYNEFKLGQKVLVKCKGMYIGDYNNLIQLGYLFNNSIGRLPDVLISNHIFRDSLPGAIPEPAVTPLTSLNFTLISKLVKFENISFTEPGTMWAPQTADATNKAIVGSTMVVRTSKYSNFASELVPAGYGDVTGILSIFGSTYQLTIRDTSDLKNFGGTAPPPPTGGDGSYEDPFTVAQVIAGSTGNAKWVTGYIVGVYETDVNPFVGNFAAPFRTNSNILIAATAGETVLASCLPVQLPFGEIRTALNLVDKPGNKGKQVKVLGNIEAYFGQPGVKSLTGYWLDGSGTVPTTGFFTEEFTTSLGQFTGVNVTGAQVWEWASFDGGCAKMTGYASGSNNANEDWLVSPQISLAGRTGVKVSFREAINYITNINDLKVLISTNYSGTGNPNSATWTELTGFTRAAGNSWDFIESGEVSLATYEGQNIRIAFKYTCTNTASATWEIGKVVLTSAK